MLFIMELACLSFIEFLHALLQKKAFHLSWDDDTSKEDNKTFESEKPETSKEKFMAFMATSVSTTPPVFF